MLKGERSRVIFAGLLATFCDRNNILSAHFHLLLSLETLKCVLKLKQMVETDDQGWCRLKAEKLERDVTGLHSHLQLLQHLTLDYLLLYRLDRWNRHRLLMLVLRCHLD